MDTPTVAPHHKCICGNVPRIEWQGSDWEPDENGSYVAHDGFWLTTCDTPGCGLSNLTRELGDHRKLVAAVRRWQYAVAYCEIRERNQPPYHYRTLADRLYAVSEHCNLPMSVVLSAQISYRQRGIQDELAPNRRLSRWMLRGWPAVKLSQGVRDDS